MTNSKGYSVATVSESPTVTMAGNFYTVLTPGTETEGRCSLFHFLVPPGGGPYRHRQHKDMCLFYVLSGNLRFYFDDRIVDATPETVVRVDKAVWHTFKNVSDQPARCLFIATPAGVEDFFTLVGKPVAETDVAPAVHPTAQYAGGLLKIAEGYGVEIDVHTELK